MLSLHMLILGRFDKDVTEKKKIISRMEPYSTVSDEMRKTYDSLKKQVNVECGKHLFVAETFEYINEYKTALRNPISTIDSKCPIGELKKKIECNYFDIVNKLVVEKKWHDIDLCSFKRKTNDNECPTCSNCDPTMFETDDTGRRVCSKCFTEIVLLEIGTTNLDYSRATVSGKFIYNRVLHFQDCIKQFQGKQNCKINQSVYDKLDEKLKAYRLLLDSDDKRIRYSKITKKHIQMFLKDTPKHYENINVIYSTLTGKSGEDISHLEYQIVEDFKELVTLYDNLHSKDKPEELARKNFLNVQYILYQLLRRHGYPCNQEDFSMLKTTERKLFHDKVCSKLFSILGWNFTKTF